MMSKTDKTSEWAPTTVAVAELGISRGHLINLKDDGTFKAGEHWRDIRRTNAARASYRWHLPSLHKILSIGPEVRKHYPIRYPVRNKAV
ncbi:hypothetical protein QUB56_35450 [Microcoleus sp. AR_TQ3_B6]|uniref:hypothetical protein n=1 Tax=Microcoleus sp. AR_TQ3_B6 TaxID=3055284 RepID=UPI002FD599CF